mgnify:CR=1 FL=1
MTPIFQFEGIYTPLVTPLLPDGTFNLDALDSQIEHLVEAGVHGLISGGSTGENYAQTVEQRLALATFTKDRLKGRLPLIVGTCTMRTPNSSALASGAREMGADAIDIGKTIHPHPTLGESIGMAAEVAHGICTDLPPSKK